MRTGRPKQPLILTEDKQDRLESLAHRARSRSRLARRAPRQITDAPVEQGVIQTLQSTPRGWAQATGLSRMTIRRIGHAFGWQPPGSETFKWPPDPQLIEKVCDLVGLYRNPPDHTLLLRTARFRPGTARNCGCLYGPGQGSVVHRTTSAMERPPGLRRWS